MKCPLGSRIHALAILFFLIACGISDSRDAVPRASPFRAWDSQGMASRECGTCHESQFQAWTDTRHNQRGVECSMCHGEFHSGALNGCLQCHTGEHKLQYKKWEFVGDYIMDDDESNYFCITCHDPHNPVREKVLVCSGCHGTSTAGMQHRKTVAYSLQNSHDLLAGVALDMDQDVWNHRLKSTGGRILFGGGLLLLGGMLFFPYVYTLLGFFRWVKKLRRKRRGH